MVLKNRIVYFVLLLVYFIWGGYTLTQYGKGELELLINKQHAPLADFFFTYWTFGGDGLFYTFVLVAFLFYSYYACIMGLILVFVKTLIVQTLKNTLFADYNRPSHYFSGNPEIYRIPGVEILTSNSFPSGHSSTAFGLATLLILLIVPENNFLKNLWQVSLLAGALLVAFSRVYLLHHFFIDTYFGAWIGVLSALGVYYMVEKSGLKTNARFQKSLLKP